MFHSGAQVPSTTSLFRSCLPVAVFQRLFPAPDVALPMWPVFGPSLHVLERSLTGSQAVSIHCPLRLATAAGIEPRQASVCSLLHAWPSSGNRPNLGPTMVVGALSPPMRNPQASDTARRGTRTVLTIRCAPSVKRKGRG